VTDRLALPGWAHPTGGSVANGDTRFCHAIVDDKL
jgi:hypothetical protein